MTIKTDNSSKIKVKEHSNKLTINVVKEQLNQKEIDLSARDENGYNALHLAIAKRNLDCVKLLINKFPDAVNSEIQMVETELSKSPTFFQDKSYSPCNALDIALETGDQEIVKYLIKKGAVSKPGNIVSNEGPSLKAEI